MRPTPRPRLYGDLATLLDAQFCLRYPPPVMVPNDDFSRDRPDYVGCVGLLFLLTLITVVLSALLTQQPGTSLLAAAPEQTATNIPATLPTLAQLAPSATSRALAFVTHTTTPTQTAIPTATLTPSATPTNTPSATPTMTLPPPYADPPVTFTPFPVPQINGLISHTVKVPIIMYHYVSTPPNFEDEVRVRLSLEPAAFREQMRYLVENGYTTIDLYELHQAITGQSELPEKPVMLTFDDGYVDAYHNVFPVLQEFGLKGNFFIITEFVDLGYAAYMTWPMIREMATAGQRMEPHTKSHPDLRGQSYDYLIYQVLGSIQTLEYHIGYRPRYFAYPGGGFDEAAIAVLQELEIWGAVSTLGGKWHGYNDRYTWRRLRMRYGMPLPEFVDLVRSADTIYGKPFHRAPTATFTPLPPRLNQP